MTEVASGEVSSGAVAAHATHIVPVPTDEEAAAIVAAVEVAWPRSAAAVEVNESRWRWSGRWWTKPVPLDRDRPW